MNARVRIAGCVLLSAVLAASGAADGEAGRLAALRAAAPADCEITRAETVASNGVTEVEYVLRPSAGSFIRCTLALPAPARWSGRFRGFGNGGSAGNVRMCSDVARGGDAAAHTDMGSSRGMLTTDNVLDFGHRATHLMTTSAKAMTEAFFGRRIAYSYFSGTSTGGGQGLHEALRYPEDYDGIVAGVPANTRLPLHIYFFWNWRELHAAAGAEVFTRAELAAVEKAALDWFADKDPPFARGRFILDSRWTPEAEDGILALAARAQPTLADPDKTARLRRLFRGPVIGGRHIHTGVPFGASFNAAQRHQWLLDWWHGYNRDGKGIGDTTLDDALAWEQAWSPMLDACRGDLGPFLRRGGKLLVYGGFEDSIVPLPSMCDWYDRAAHAAGGVDKLAEGVRLYLIPGFAHGPGRHIKGISDARRLMSDWVEKGIRPDAVPVESRDGTETFLLSPYPDNTFRVRP